VELGLEGELAVYNRRGGARKQFKFDRVFGPDASQAGVYEDTKFLIRSVLDGARRPSPAAAHVHCTQCCLSRLHVLVRKREEALPCGLYFYCYFFLGTNGKAAAHLCLPPRHVSLTLG